LKIRNGFVSNSSSSSFVMVVHRATHNEAMRRLPENYRKIMEQAVEFKTAMGTELAVFWNFSDAGGNSNYSGSLNYWDYANVKENEHEEYLLYNATEAYENLCRKLEPDLLTINPSDGG
jgi:CRISPR/Cas system CSM-associated protein Csm4 (group 5 of RAMP superfamily)